MINTIENKMQSFDYQEFANTPQLFVRTLKNELDNTGFALVHNYPINYLNLDETKEDYLRLCEKLGKPISHDTKNSIIWDIKTNPTSGKNGGVITYSEHNHEADLHTDSQYSEYPEDYFGLLTLHKADCGGGLSYILTFADIIEELEASEEGRKALEIFQTTDFPFIVPNVFKRQGNTEPEFVFGRIIKDGEIRFRVDTIQKALDYNPDFCTAAQTAAFHLLVNLVRTTKKTKKFFLEDNDLVMINNKTTLHGRGSFTDYKRHLLRIRMNKFSKV